MITQKIRSYDDKKSATWIWYTLLIRATWSLQRKTSVPDRSKFEIKHHIIRDEVQKGESGSPTHISTDEQISRHFGKASIQDERVCVFKLELVETTSLLKKEEMTPRLGGVAILIHTCKRELEFGSLSVSLEAQCLGSQPTLSLWPEPLLFRLTPREAKGGSP